jgi:hypothetical protein
VHTRGRKGKCFFPCTVKVDIEGLGDTYLIDPNNPPNPGRPVAHLHNQDQKKTEKHYGLLPGTQADYYLWVDAKSATQAQWTLLELSHTTDSVYAALPTNLNYCHKYPRDSVPVSDADFAADKQGGACNFPIPDTNPKIGQAALMPTSAFVALFKYAIALLTTIAPSGGGWIYCSHGCCT